MYRFCFLIPVVVLVLGGEARADTSGPDILDRAGFLVLASARDSSSGIDHRTGPGPGQISWFWDGGQLVLPDTLSLDTFGAQDLGVGTLAGLRGSGAGGVLRFRDGKFAIDQPLLLTDGRISLYVARGTLEIRGAQVRYVPPDATLAPRKVADPRAGFLFLAGMVILTLVLLRLARRRLGGRSS